MNEPIPVTVALRIPGQWSNPGELIDRLPPGCRLTAETLTMPDESLVEFGAATADDQFPEIFHSSCRKPPSDAERAIVDRYTVNIFLSGPGGSLDAARAMMRAAAVIVKAGGAGVFIDNCGLAHGGQDWLDLTDDASPDALGFAFVALVQGKTDVSTMGLHVLGQRELVMKRTDVDAGFDIIEVIRYVCRGDKPIDEGHIFADLDGQRFQFRLQDSDARLAGSPMYNPFGAMKLLSVSGIAKQN